YRDQGRSFIMGLLSGPGCAVPAHVTVDRPLPDFLWALSQASAYTGSREWRAPDGARRADLDPTLYLAFQPSGLAEPIFLVRNCESKCHIHTVLCSWNNRFAFCRQARFTPTPSRQCKC